MPSYVYIIKSGKDGSYYKGFTEQPLVRLLQHNNGESKYTSQKTPWKLVFLQTCSSKREALIREKALKKYSQLQVEALIDSHFKVLTDFIKTNNR